MFCHGLPTLQTQNLTGYYVVTEGERVRQHQHCGMWIGDFATTWGTTLGQYEGHQKYCR